MTTWGIWYIYEDFLIWIIPSTYQSHESIIWACTTSFVHICIYRMLDVSSHAYVYICSRHHFLCMFSDSDLSIHLYLLSDLLWILWFLFMLLVIACTCMSEPYHLIMYKCDCLSTPLGFILRTCWVAFWQPLTFMSRSRTVDRGGLTVAD